MAQTKDGKKLVHVGPYVQKDGTKVPEHYRTPPCPAKPTKT